MYFIEIWSMISQAASPSSHSTTRPRTMTGSNGLSAGARDSATRGSRRRLRALREPRAGEEDDLVAVRADPERHGVGRAVRQDGGEVGERGAVEGVAYVGLSMVLIS